MRKWTWLIAIIITIFAGVGIGLAGWNFKEVSDIPKIYSTKTEVDQKIESHEKRHEVFESAIKDNFDKMFTMQRDIQRNIDELNKKVR